MATKEPDKIMKLPFRIKFHLWHISKLDKRIERLKEAKKKNQAVIGNELRLIRQENKLTASEVAKWLGTSRATISMLETGKTIPSETTCKQLIKAIKELK